MCSEVHKCIGSFIKFSITTGSKYEFSSVQSGGALKIHQVDSNQDSGIYTCIVKNRANEEARRDIELTVNSIYKAYLHVHFLILSQVNFNIFRPASY